jgi:hypothetical protein
MLIIHCTYFRVNLRLPLELVKTVNNSSVTHSNSMEYRPFSEANSPSASLIWDHKIYEGAQKVRHWLVSWDRWVQSTSSRLISSSSILLSILIHAQISQATIRKFVCICLISHSCYSFLPNAVCLKIKLGKSSLYKHIFQNYTIKIGS